MLKLKSKTDVITNSSSEVFIIRKDLITDDTFTTGDHGQLIDEEFFKDTWETDSIIEAFDLPEVDTCTRKDWYSKYYRENKKALDDILGRYCFVEIEDHYDDWEEDTDTAHSLCTWSESRH